MNQTTSQTSDSPQLELPRYRSHKEVRALKIKEVIIGYDTSRGTPTFQGAEIRFEDGRYAPILVEDSYVAKHNPQAGGYYVVYPDGYKSWSPAGAFEDGYTALASAGMTFGNALESLKRGARVARAGWNGKGMWLSLSNDRPRVIRADKFWSRNNADYAAENGGWAKVLPCITMKTATGEILMGWLASQTDILAEDWTEV